MTWEAVVKTQHVGHLASNFWVDRPHRIGQSTPLAHFAVPGSDLLS